MGNAYKVADESVIAVLDAVRSEFHTDLEGVAIRVLMYNKRKVVQGRPKAAWVKLVTDQERALGITADATISIVEALWQSMSAETRRALMDHELCHIQVSTDADGFKKIVLIGHDVEEFHEVVARHGAWHDDLAVLVSNAVDDSRLHE